MVDEHTAPDATEPTPSHTGSELDILSSSLVSLNTQHRADAITRHLNNKHGFHFHESPLKKPLDAHHPSRSNAVELAISTLAAIGILTIAALVGVGIAAVLHFGM